MSKDNNFKLISKEKCIKVLVVNSDYLSTCVIDLKWFSFVDHSASNSIRALKILTAY